jgi:hypothetical protein
LYSLVLKAGRGLVHLASREGFRARDARSDGPLNGASLYPTPDGSRRYARAEQQAAAVQASPIALHSHRPTGR